MDPNISRRFDYLLLSDNNCDELDKYIGDVKNHNIDINDVRINRIPLLVRCAMGGYIESTKILVKHGINIDQRQILLRDIKGDTALTLSCWQYWHENKESGKTHFAVMIKYLIECGADCNLRDESNNTPLMLLCHRDSILTESSIKENIELVELLLKHGADHKLVDDSGQTAEQIARLNHHESIADAIMNYQDIPDTKGVIQEGK